MAADRRWDQRRFQLEESTTLNGGARTIFIEHMTPGTSVPPHFHTRFSETFDLLSGSITVYNSTTPDLTTLTSSAQELKTRVPVTVKPGEFHFYKVGEEESTLRVIVEPGDRDFERLLMVMNGLDRDGRMAELGDSVVLMAVIMGLSDAHLIGDAKDMLDGVKKEKGEEIESLRKELLEKYDTEEGLRGLLGNIV